MGRSYVIAGHTLHWDSLIALIASERDELHARGQVAVRRLLEWPIPDRLPRLEAAYVDPGNTDIWGPGPYLKVPNWQPPDTETESVNRVFCPWGYPPAMIRLSRRSEYVQIERVQLLRDGHWLWELVLRAAHRGVPRTALVEEPR